MFSLKMLLRQYHDSGHSLIVHEWPFHDFSHPLTPSQRYATTLQGP